MSKKTEWLQAIADRVGLSTGDITAVLNQTRVYPAPVAGSPRRLVLRDIGFSGEKFGIEESGPFEFRWNELDRGLYAMLTDSNLKGKSSVVEVVKWMIRGRPGDNLQDDVRSWIHECRLRFEIDGALHEVQAFTREGVTGQLLRIDSGGERKLAGFDNDGEFESVMADFFMNQFALGPVTRWQGGAEEEGGISVVHGWPSLAGAMFIGTNYASILGDVPPTAGLSTPLMQMYLGLPWISTLTAAKTAQQAFRKETEARLRRYRAGQAERERRISIIKTELESRRTLLNKTPSDEAIQRSLRETGAELARQTTEERRLAQRLERERAGVEQLQTAHAEDRRELQTHLDSEAAAAVFRMLSPSVCPRCDTAIDEDRKKREKATHECSVCGEDIATDEDAKQRRDTLEQAVKETGSALTKAQRAYEAVESSLATTRTSVEQLNQSLEKLTQGLENFGERRRLETEVLILEARLAEVAEFADPEETPGDNGRILDAVVEETEARVKLEQADLLRAVSEEITRYARRFGMAALNSVTLRGNVTMPLVKGGNRTAYGRVTAGEKLRLKVATVLAMISVAESRGLGRHPGLLMIDSPGAQEVARKDLEELAAGLQEISQELGHLQVFVAAVASDAIRGHIPPERVRYAGGDAPLW